MIADLEIDSEYNKHEARSINFELIDGLLYRIRDQVDGASRQFSKFDEIKNEIMHGFHDCPIAGAHQKLLRP